MITIALVAVLAVPAPAANAEQAQPPQVAVRWLVDLSPDRDSEKGVTRVPVEDPSGDCLSKFALTGIATWQVQEKGTNGHPDVRSGISISIRKLFEGKSPVPEVTILQTVDELTLPVIYSFRATRTTESKGWTAGDAEYSETFDALDLSGHQSWTRILLRCRD